MCLLVFLVTIRLVLCSLRSWAGFGNGEVCTVDASAAIFAVSPLLVTVVKSFFSPRWLPAVSHRGLGDDGDAGGYTPGCSVILIKCMHWRVWRNTSYNIVRTTTKTHHTHTTRHTRDPLHRHADTDRQTDTDTDTETNK